jgi:hypothetical protein
MSITSKGRAALSRLIGAGELIEATPTLCTLGLDLDDQACRLPFSGTNPWRDIAILRRR